MPARLSILNGIPAAHGIAFGEIYVLDRKRLVVPHRALDPEEVPEELERFKTAVAKSRFQLECLLDKVVAKSMGSEHTYILEAHMLMLDDPELMQGVHLGMRNGQNAEWALANFFDSLKERFSRIDDDYLKERGSDIDQVGQRILFNLLGNTDDSLDHIPQGAILVAHDLAPSDTAQLGRGRIAGFVTEVGGSTSHVAILARSMGIPAIVGVEGVLETVSRGEFAVLDGRDGLLLVHPDGDTLERYRQAKSVMLERLRCQRRNRTKRAVSLDGHRIGLQANIELMEEMALLSTHGAEGVGMYRTEYLFMAHGREPSEELQFESYRQLVQECGTQTVTIRTFDLGADKVQTDADVGVENPALGFRAVRYSLLQQPLFEKQIRACLRASAFGSLRIMLPMVCTLSEVREVKTIIARCREQLQSQGVKMAKRVPLGIMVETPASALLADRFAQEVDFFSIGTNDLVQYTLAVDRMNDQLNYLYQPLHPAILRLIHSVMSGAARAGIPVSLCGEMAGEPVFAYALMGLGLESLSMSPVMIPAVKDVICRTSAREAQRVIRGAMQEACTYEDVLSRVVESLSLMAPEVIGNLDI